ncbi:Uncharacterized protein Adt_03264 [Abeliophyllum distichum]|uniref:Ubiquitin-like protease family profile domain-containing protein n=1 Tax=Abeliophyllum distichum TaxID=126358 RepID=A0ABD1VYH6_9LAMI
MSCKILQNSNNSNFANSKPVFGSNNIIFIAIVLALTTPLPTLTITSLNSQPFSLSSTPFSQANNLPTGLQYGGLQLLKKEGFGVVSIKNEVFLLQSNQEGMVEDRVCLVSRDYSRSDCGLFTVKFIEFSLAELDLNLVQPKHMLMWRQKMAAEIFGGKFDPLNEFM